MIGNELYEPLKGKPDGRGAPRTVRLAASIFMGVCAALAATVLVMRAPGGQGGEPEAVGTIERPAPIVVAAASLNPAPSAPAPPAAPVADASTAAHFAGQSVEIQNGVKIYRPIYNASPGMDVIKVPPAEAEPIPAGADARLIESGPYGPLPRIGADGARPADVYARRSGPAADGRPKVALLVGGFGFDRAATARAAASLPAPVTLGFAPYGEDLAAQVRGARDAGHEVVLQLPMEAAGKNDSPPTHMLTTDPTKTGDDLAWLLSRFTGYAGVANLLGGRILGNEAALRPVLQTIAARGLYFLEDGSTAHSLVDPVARDIGLASSRADVVIDARSDSAAVEAALTRLDGLARGRGTVIASAIASPESIEAIERFAGSLAARGIDLVPLSQAVKAKKAIIQSGLFRTP